MEHAVKITFLVLALGTLIFLAAKNVINDLFYINEESEKDKKEKKEIECTELLDTNFKVAPEGRLTDREWVTLIELTVKYSHQGLKLGQSYMNALAEVRMDLYDKVTNTEYDCTYFDSDIHKLMEFLNQKPI
jgi:hypothetical protein